MSSTLFTDEETEAQRSQLDVVETNKQTNKPECLFNVLQRPAGITVSGLAWK